MNMNIYYCSIILLFAGFCVISVNSAVALLSPEEKPKDMENEEGCYVASLKKVLSYNVPYSPQDDQNCVQYTCRNDGFTMIFSCGAIAVSDNCYVLKGDKSLPYPDCCDKPTC